MKPKTCFKERIDSCFLKLDKILGTQGSQIIKNVSLKVLTMELKKQYEEVEKYFNSLDRIYEMKIDMVNSIINKNEIALN